MMAINENKTDTDICVAVDKCRILSAFTAFMSIKMCSLIAQSRMSVEYVTFAVLPVERGVS